LERTVASAVWKYGSSGVEELIDFFLVVTAPAGRAEPAVPDPIDQLADGRRDVRARSGPSDQLGELADQVLNAVSG
jgi:hypothetical protein